MTEEQEKMLRDMTAAAGGTTVKGSDRHQTALDLDEMGYLKDVAHGPDWVSWKVTRRGLGASIGMEAVIGQGSAA